MGNRQEIDRVLTGEYGGDWHVDAGDFSSYAKGEVVRATFTGGADEIILRTFPKRAKRKKIKPTQVMVDGVRHVAHDTAVDSRFRAQGSTNFGKPIRPKP